MNTIFIIISILLFLSLLTGSLYFYKHENRFVRARSVTIGAILMTIYSIFSLWALLNSSIPAKPVLFICGISPL